MCILSCSVGLCTTEILAENPLEGHLLDLNEQVPIVAIFNTLMYPRLDSVHITTIWKPSRIELFPSSYSDLSRRHPGRKIPLSPKTPQFFSPGSTTCETLAHLETP